MATVDLRKYNDEVRKKAQMIHGSRPKRYLDIYRVRRYKKYVSRQKYKYFVPRDKKTAVQIELRDKFARAVATWKSFSPYDKNVWNALALKKPMSGYNMFLSFFMKNHNYILQENDGILLQENNNALLQ